MDELWRDFEAAEEAAEQRFQEERAQDERANAALAEVAECFAIDHEIALQVLILAQEYAQ